MSREQRLVGPCLIVLLIGCGSAPPPEEPVETAPTAGDEARAEPAPTSAAVPEPSLPEPAVARDQLSAPMQALWDAIERIVAMRPPERPSGEAANAWVQGPFREWVALRGQRMLAAIEASEAIDDDPAYERALVAALLAHALEDFAASVRGAPVPESVAADPEMLESDVDHLNAMARAAALQAVTYDTYCERRLTALGEDSPWLAWRNHCAQRGQEMSSTYEIEAPE